MTDPASGAPLLDFLADMRRLRAECAWKREQTHRSLARYLLEETHETLEAIDTGEATGDWDHLRDELGDLLLQVYFHAVVAEEDGAFTIDDVARGIAEKMHRRNPHVFGDAPGGTAAEINDQWQAIKATEPTRPGRTGSVLDELPPGLPALLLADKVLDRLERRGVSWSSGSDDLGDRLLALVAEAHADGVDPEQALRDAVRRAASGDGA